MHGAEARARFPRRCSETRKIHAPKTKFFTRKNDDCVLAPEEDYYWLQDGPLNAPRRRQLNFSDLDPPKPQDHAPKTLFFTEKIEDLMFWAMDIVTKICTPLGPEHDFRNDVPKPEQVMLPKACFFARKIEDFVFSGIMIAQVIIQKYARRWGQSTIFEMMFRNLNK